MIDVHHHILPPEYVAQVGAQAIASPGSAGKVPAWSVGACIEGMDLAGIRVAVTSISAPGLAPLAAPAAVRMATWCNDYAARLRQDRPGRFGAFATLPLPQVDASLREVAHACDVLQLDGVCLFSSYEGRYLGAPEFEPLYEELNRRDAVVFIHPSAPDRHPALADVSLSTLEFPFDTTRAITSLVLAGVTVRHPRIRFIAGHGGGTMPFVAARIDALMRNRPGVLEALPRGFLAEVARFHLDCTLATSDGQLAAMEQLVGAGNLLFGTDYPFGPREQMRLAAHEAARPALGRPSLGGLLTGNARRLFTRLQAA